MFEPRTYRASVAGEGLVPFIVRVAETDLQILARSDLTTLAERSVRDARADLESYLAAHPRFGESYVPVDADPGAPAIVRAMADAASASGVGPMAAVAGAFAEHVARELHAHSDEVIVENGGDVYLIGATERVVALWAGTEGVSGVGIKLPARALPRAVATSSGTIGPSLSFGTADTATVVAPSGALADAVASVVGNRVRSAEDLARAVEAGLAVPGVSGVVVSVAGALAAGGDVELVPVRTPSGG